MVASMIGSWFFGLSFLLFILVQLTAIRLRIQKWLESTLSGSQAVENDLTELYSPQIRDQESQAREEGKRQQRIDRQ